MPTKSPGSMQRSAFLLAALINFNEAFCKDESHDNGWVSEQWWKVMKQILIVEDDPDLQHLIKSVLKRAGFDVILYPDGRSLMEPFSPPDLFIFDIELPFMNGLELCRKMKGAADTSHIPVLIVSASSNLLSQAKDACADAALGKPIDAAKLVAQVNVLLQPLR